MYSNIALVAKVHNGDTLILNKGALAKMEIGQRFQIFSIGEDIIDPETQQNLGKLEIIRGTGKVIHVQEKISILKSDMKTSPSKTIRRPKKESSIRATSFISLAASIRGEEIEEILPPETVCFDSPEVGDKARPI